MNKEIYGTSPIEVANKLIDKREAQRYEEKRQALKAALKKRFPSIVSILAMSDETSKLMKEENRRKRIEAFQKKVKR